MIRGFTKYLLIQCFFVTIFNFTFAQTPKIDSLQAILKTLPADSNRVNTLNKLGELLTHLSDSERIRQTANDAITLSQTIDFPKGEANGYKRLSYYNYRLGNTPEAIELLLKALRIYEKIGAHNMIGASYNNIGVIYESQNDLGAALSYFNKALALWKKHSYKDGIIRALGNIADIYEKKHLDSLALDYYHQSLQLAKEINDRVVVSSNLSDIGSIYFKRKEYTKSFDYQNEAMQFAVESGNVIAQARVFNAMSQIHLAQNQPGEALLVAERALKIAVKATSRSDRATSYSMIYKAHEKLNDYRNAYEFQSLYLALNDSLKNLENVGSIEKLKHRYELDKKESEITLLTQRNQAEALRRNMFIVALTGLLIISLLLYNRFRLIVQRKFALKKQQLTFYTQSLIEKSETINRINMELEQFKNNGSNEDVQIAKIDKILQSNILTDEDWEKFKKAFEDIFPSFFSKLRWKYPTITVSELRLSALIKLNLSTKEIASMLGISPNSVNASRYRFKKKLGLTDNETVEEVIKELEIPFS